MYTKTLIHSEILNLVDIKPISINRAYYRNGNLTTESRHYRDKFHILLNNESSKVKSLNKALESIEYPHIDLSITVETPKKLLFKKGTLTYSHLSGDMNNYTKLIEDFLFQHRYRGRLTSLGTPYHIIRIDDRFVKSGSSLQIPSPSDTWNLTITISIHKLELPSEL